MIYLIDEKTNRQSNYGWSAQKFEYYKEIIKPINGYDNFTNIEFNNTIVSEGNLVLFHESFFNGIEQNKKYLAEEFKGKLEAAAISQKIELVYYGGSKNSRKRVGNITYMPVSVFYEHLELFLEKYTNEEYNKCDIIDYLIWGDNPKIEKELVEKIRQANNSIEDRQTISPNVIFIVAAKNEIRLDLPWLKSDTKELFPDIKADDPVSDGLLHSYIVEWLGNKEYDAIILPLCFGPALSDYNGLRLALHIRCTSTINQFKPIYIYSVVGLSSLIYNDYFDIVKSEDIHLIEYNSQSIYSSLTADYSTHKVISLDELKNDIKKVRVKIPHNYTDSHSIANEWAIYRWANVIDANDDGISKIIKNVETNLYFKYLNTCYPIHSNEILKDNNMKISTTVKPKVLLVDDEAEKGWYEIFCKILYDINNFEFEYVDDEFNEKSTDEIVKIVHDRIVDDDIDIVILDFRLHRSDFFVEKIEDIVGYKILEDIKNNINSGIQVIILSATNKVWNWEKLKNAGADGFIMKDNPENIYEEFATKNNVEKLLKTIQNCCDKLFLKQFYKNYKSLISNFKPRINKKHNKPLAKEFVEEVLKLFLMSCDILKLNIYDATISTSFITLFSIIENISNNVIDEDNPVIDYDNNGEIINKYKFRRNGVFLKSFNKESAIKSNLDLALPPKRRIPWEQKILNTLDYLKVVNDANKLKGLIDKRHAFIHSNSIKNNSVISIDDIKYLHQMVFDCLTNI